MNKKVLGKAFRMFGTLENPLFLAKDVAEWIEHSNPRMMLQTVDDDEKVVNNVYTPGGNQETWFLTENGLYEVLMQSRKPIAKDFKKKVKEILKTIRKTGGYVNNDDLFIRTYLPFADEQTKVMFAQTLKTVREQNAKIQQQKEEILYKENVIIGLVDNIDLAEKRQRINQIIRHGKRNNYRERFSLLYSEFNKKYHCDIKRQMQNSDLKPKAKNVIDYIDRKLNMIPQLFELTCKLFENDVELLKKEWEATVK